MATSYQPTTSTTNTSSGNQNGSSTYQFTLANTRDFAGQNPAFYTAVAAAVGKNTPSFVQGAQQFGGVNQAPLEARDFSLQATARAVDPKVLLEQQAEKDRLIPLTAIDREAAKVDLHVAGLYVAEGGKRSEVDIGKEIAELADKSKGHVKDIAHTDDGLKTPTHGASVPDTFIGRLV